MVTHYKPYVTHTFYGYTSKGHILYETEIKTSHGAGALSLSF
jgi:hypothetical protein